VPWQSQPLYGQSVIAQAVTFLKRTLNAYPMRIHATA